MRLFTTALTLAALALPMVAHAQSASRDLAAEAANRTLVLDFYDQVFNRHEVAEGAKVIADS